MPETKRPLKVFLCHSSSDKPKVREWYRRLVADGVDAWLDVESLLPGQKWKEEIPQAIKNSDVVLVFLSKESINKEGFVQKEIKEALDIAGEKPEHAIFIIPARLEDCNVPNRLADYHWVDLFDSDGYKKLVSALVARAKTVNATLLPAKISKIDEVKSKAVEFEKRGDFAKSLSAYFELKKLDPFYSGIDEKIQDLELNSLESQAIQCELKGDFWNARKIWYKIKRVDHLYPRVDIKIRELEQVLQHKQIPQLKATKQEPQGHQGLGRKAILAFLGGIALILFAVIGSPILVSVISRTPTPIVTVTPTRKLILTKTIVPTATKTKVPETIRTSVPTKLPDEMRDSKGVLLVIVPAGEFTMGSDKGYSDEMPVHKVYLDDFYIDKYEVTNALYKKCVDVGICTKPEETGSETRSNYYGNSEFDNFPVVYMNWEQANIYCEWRGASLPTEAQWEKAARGTDGRTYPWGENLVCGQNANFGGCLGDTTEVGAFEGGKSPYGVYDMMGNASEWVADLYSETYYQISPYKNPLGLVTPDQKVGNRRVVRGFSFYYNDYFQAKKPTITSRYHWYSWYSSGVGNFGFRCARNLNP